MCGIVGYVGDDEALPIVLEGLRRLEYRGYDSAGVAVLQDGDSMAVAKRAGKVLELEKALDEEGHPQGTVGMGHTRWATHGAPNDQNAHPHRTVTAGWRSSTTGSSRTSPSSGTACRRTATLCASDTDTEVVAHLIEEQLRDGAALADAVRGSLAELTGAYALVVMSADEPDVIVGAKVSSPLVVGFGDGENLLASAIPALLSGPTASMRSKRARSSSCGAAGSS